MRLPAGQFVRAHRAALVNIDAIESYGGEDGVLVLRLKDGTRVEMIVNAEHNGMFVAHHDQGDAYACIDGCVDKLERQLSEHKKKVRNRKHPGA